MSESSGLHPTASEEPEVDPRRMRSVVAASAAGTVFEWYDFFIFAILTSIISRQTSADRTASTPTAIAMQPKSTLRR